MTLRESKRLLAGAKNLERQANGWKTFGLVVVVFGLVGFVIVTVVRLITA